MNIERINELETEFESLKNDEDRRKWLRSLTTEELTSVIKYRLSVDFDKKLPELIARFKAAWDIP